MGFTAGADSPRVNRLSGGFPPGATERGVGSEAQAAGAGARRKGRSRIGELHPTGEESQVVPEPSRSGHPAQGHLSAPSRRFGDFVLDLTNGSGDCVFSPGRYRLDWRLRPAADSSGPRIPDRHRHQRRPVGREGRLGRVLKYLFQVRLELEGRSTEPFLPRDIPAHWPGW